MKKTGDIVRIGSNDYVLGEKLGGGLEGNVFDFESNSKFYNKHVIKIINESGKSNLKKNKIYEHLKWLRSKNTKDSELPKYVILPHTILGSDLGYVMQKTNNYSSLKKYLQVDFDDFDTWYKEKYTLKKRYEIIRSLFSALYRIHYEGLVFSDLSPNNIMIHNERNNVVFIDSDNIKRRSDCYCEVYGTPGYMAPEIYRNAGDVAKDNKIEIDPKLLTNCGTITADSDIFSAAVIAFELLTLQHPFVGDIIDEGTPEDEERAHRCETDYIFKEDTENTCTRMLCGVFDKITTKEIRDLFYKTFVVGKDKPSLRPTDEDFYEAFSRAYESIVICPKCKFEQIYDKKNPICEDCNCVFENKVVLEIYMRYKNMSRAQIINQMGFEDIIVGEGCNFDFDGKKKSDSFLVSRIVLEPGITKHLYLRHFEETMERNKQSCIALSISPERSDRVYITINTKLVDDPKYAPFISDIKIIDNNGRIEFVDSKSDREQHYKFEDRYIVFGEKEIGKTKLQIYGRFIKN